MTKPDSPAAYSVPAPLFQAVISVLAALPWGQVDQVMSPLRDIVRQQEAAPPAAAESVSTPAAEA